MNKFTEDGRQTPEYTAWNGMHQRCYSPNNTSYRNYGGRGIKVCARWYGSFDAFCEDMGPRPSSKHSLERRDNNKGYSPDNCYWATIQEQAVNKRMRADNATGLPGVSFDKTFNRWVARGIKGGVNTTLGTSRDFFEACCIRKSHDYKRAGVTNNG